MDLRDRLNKFEATAHCTHSVVEVEVVPNDDDCDAEGNVTNQELLELLNDLDRAETYIDAHPEGSDRGGYVCYVELDGDTAYYMENANEWY